MSKLWYRLMSGMLTLLGFTACGDEGKSYEYGTPHASYSIKGKVINQQKESIPGIQVIVKGKPKDSPEGLLPSDTVYTDVKGEFMFHDNDAWPGTDYRVICKDIDGSENGGTFKTDSIDVEMGKLSGGEGWYEGSASKEVTITLSEATYVVEEYL